MTQTLTVEGKASALGAAAVLEGNPARANDTLDDIRRVTVEDLQRVGPHVSDSRAADQCQNSRQHCAAGAKKNGEDDAPITATPEDQAPRPGRAGVTRAARLFPGAPAGRALGCRAAALGAH